MDKIKCKQGWLYLTADELVLERHIVGLATEYIRFPRGEIERVDARITAKGTDTSPEIFHLTVRRRNGEQMDVSMVPRPDYEALMKELGLPVTA
jgi:hypothetical protein